MPVRRLPGSAAAQRQWSVGGGPDFFASDERYIHPAESESNFWNHRPTRGACGADLSLRTSREDALAYIRSLGR